jgi:hypothetical protein
MKHIITSYFVNSNDKEGKPFKTKEGKPFKKVVIKVAPDPSNPQPYDDKYLSNLSFNADDRCLAWQIGDEVDIKVEKNGEFWNFKVPSRLDMLEIEVKNLKQEVQSLKDFLLPTKENEAPQEDYEDLPDEF